MWTSIDLQEELTIGKLRELITTGKLSEFPNNTPIRMRINLDTTNVCDPDDEPYAPVVSIVGDKEEISFYNYI